MLVLIGGEPKRCAALIGASPVGGVIRLVADRADDVLVSEAAVLAFPSEYEGLGAPLVEAMALDTVVCGDQTHEVVADAGVVVRRCRPRRGRAPSTRRCTAATSHRGRLRTLPPSRWGHRDRRSPTRMTGWPVGEDFVLCPHFEPDTAPTGTVMTRLVGELLGSHELHVVTALPWYREHRIDGLAGRPVAPRRSRARSRVHPFPGADKRNLVRRRVRRLLGARRRRSAACGWLVPPRRRGAGDVAAAHARAHRLVDRAPGGRPSCSTSRTSSPTQRTGAITNRRGSLRPGRARQLPPRLLSPSSATTCGRTWPPRSRASHRRRIHVIPNFVDTDVVTPADRITAYRTELGIGDEPVVLYRATSGSPSRST